MEAVLVLVLAVIACVVIYAVSVAPKRKAPRTAVTLKRELDKLTHDPRASESLLARERERSPDASELEVLETVLRRLKRERRR
ncbi:MAG: hypothetical protein J0L89_03715 [Xanthomonadales bacterium]|nr:hypothetical protein [Xanthomonadales bacterium]MBN8613443.1 hypothetical protein [Deltaproteobacteria bacterium]